MFIDKAIFDERECYSLGNGMGRIQFRKDKGVSKRLYRIAKKMDKSDYDVTGFSIDFTKNKAYVNYLSESELVQLCECDNLCEVIEFYRAHASEEDIKITFEKSEYPYYAEREYVKNRSRNNIVAGDRLHDSDNAMLNIEKFRNNFKITIQGVFKTVYEWGEDGEGNYCFSSGMEYYNRSFDVDINHIEEIGNRVIESINNSNYSSMKESDFTIIDNRLNWSQIENGDGNILETQEEVKTAEKTYICDYDVFISINGIELEEEDLRALFHEAQ